MPGLEFVLRIPGPVRSNGGILPAHPREEGIPVDFLLLYRCLHIPEIVRFPFGSLVLRLASVRGFALLDEVYRLLLVDRLSLRHPSVALPADDRLLLFLEINQEGLLLRRRIKVLYPREAAEQQSDQMDRHRQHDAGHGCGFALFLSVTKILFHHSGCVASMTL